jgi:hypothetical protein
MDAHVKGRAIGEGGRLLTCSPLLVRFRVDEGDRKVFVEALDFVA